MAKGQPLQIVDLGSHYLKAIQCEFQDGRLSVSQAHAIPLAASGNDVDSFMADLIGAFDKLAAVLNKKVPVSFLANEQLCPIGVAYLNNVPRAGIDEALNNEQTKFVSTFGVSTYETSVSGTSRPFKLREKVDGEKAHVVVATSYAKTFYLDQIIENCKIHKLSYGGIYPRIFAYKDLFHLAFGGPGGEMPTKVGVLVDIGYASTEIVAFKDGNIVFHKILHMGGRDFRGAISDVDRSAGNVDPVTLVSIMSTVGVTGDESTAASLGLPIDAGGVVRAIQEQAEQLLTKIQLAIDYFSTVAATDFNTSMNTVMAVRRGPEVIAFSGGVASCPGFLEMVSQSFENAMVLNPQEFLQMGTIKGDLPASAFSLISGGAAMVGHNRDPMYNLGDSPDRFASAGGGGGGGGGGAQAEPFVPNWAMALMMIYLLALGGFWWHKGQTIKTLQQELAEKQATLESHHDLVVRFRDAREKEQLAQLQLEYLSEITTNRVNWSIFVDDLAGIMPEGVKLTNVSVLTDLPSSGSSPEAKPTGKQVSFALCGEGQDRTAVTEFVRQLRDFKNFEIVGSPSIQLAGQGAGEGAVCTPPAGDSAIHVRHYSFLVKGHLKY